MSGRRVLVATLVAAGLGAVCGEALRSRAPSGPGRPAAVESVLRAVDADDPFALARALDQAGEPSRWPMPWRDEVALGRAVATGDLEAALAFAAGEPAGPARARALLYVRDKAKDAATRDRARRMLAERYPHSWALAAGRDGPR